MARVCVIIALLVCSALAYESNEHWREIAKEDIQRARRLRPNEKIAKNVVLMVGDGMGLPTVTASRIYKGQKLGMYGEEYKLSFEQFPNVALMKTYNLDRQVPDSAGTASAIMTGVKVNMGTLGVDGEVPFKPDCSTYTTDRNLQTILDIALAEGKSVGLVTTTRITHATPGSTYAHTPFRDWESVTQMEGVNGCEKVKDIAYQLVYDNPNINVLLGGGRRSFLNNTTPDPYTNKIASQQRNDGLDLREVWKNKKQMDGKRYAYVENTRQLKDVDASNTDYLMGLFSSSHMTYELERDKSDNGEPSLVEMTEKALQILKKNPKGFFLLMEGGRIDHAHHDNYGKKALEETDVFDEAVQLILAQTSNEDTLQIVTADHSHVFGIAGYPTRGNDILGLVDDVVPGEETTDGLPYLTLAYSNGPAYGRTDLTNVDTTTDDFQQPGCVQMPYETHGGEDVSVYAQGPMAHLFHTTHEQTYIHHVMLYSACMGHFSMDCDRLERSDPKKYDTCGASSMLLSPMVVGVMALLVVAGLHRFL